jgi:hypothetical protein
MCKARLVSSFHWGWKLQNKLHLWFTVSSAKVVNALELNVFCI